MKPAVFNSDQRIINKKTVLGGLFIILVIWVLSSFSDPSVVSSF